MPRHPSELSPQRTVPKLVPSYRGKAAPQCVAIRILSLYRLEHYAVVARQGRAVVKPGREYLNWYALPIKRIASPPNAGL